jgi:competence protein ComEC
MLPEKPRLFDTPKEFILFAAVMVLIFGLRIGWEYRQYRAFVSAPFLYAHATVTATYPKERNGRTYAILKLHTDKGRTLYTSSAHTDLQTGTRLYLQLLPTARIAFWDYVSGTYVKSRIKKIFPPPATLKMRLRQWVDAQHADARMGALYNALFWADPIPRELRERIARLGVSHLVALSGLHLTLLWGVLYGGLAWIYRQGQRRWFPQRYVLRDVGGVAMAVLLGYVLMTGAPPSLVRAFAMVFIGWIMVLMGIELVSFTFLGAVVALLLALVPSWVVSLGFWLSVAGVFYIFLVLKYCRQSNKYLVGLVCIPVGIFVLMQPLVHGFFGVTTPWQLLSPLLSIGFTFFYPLALVSHLIGAGGWFDTAIIRLLELPRSWHETVWPAGWVAAYVVLSFAAVRWRWGWYALIATAAAVTGYVLM